MSLPQSSASSSAFAAPSSIARFPVIPASQPLPNQSCQTPLQVQSILNLPTKLLLNLARTHNPLEQQEIASKAEASSYLSSMALPPPSPRKLASAIADSAGVPLTPVEVVAIGDHPAIPLLLGQGFCPPTPGITAPLASSGPPTFEPVYASVEAWSRETARHRIDQDNLNQSTSAAIHGRPALATSHSFNEREVDTVAQQMKAWALSEQEQQVQQQVMGGKEEAVLLSAQVAARKAVVGEVEKARVAVTRAPSAVSEPMRQMVTSMTSGGAQAGAAMDTALQSMDLSAYAETYRLQLDALASGKPRERLESCCLAGWDG